MLPVATKKQSADDIVKKGGLILSEYPPLYPGGTYTFPARNRIIAGLSVGTVVLEAPLGSGALITADLALDYSREVFAVPGPIYDANYAGSNTLIAKGHGKLVQSAAEVLRELGIQVPETLQKAVESTYTPQNPEEEAIWAVLTALPQSTDDIVQRAKRDTSTVTATLTMLELSGAVRNVGNSRWIRL